MGDGAIIAFEMMSDAELACLYHALTGLIATVAKDTIPPGSEKEYGGRLSAVLAFIDEPKLRGLYYLGHQTHREIERRGRRHVARYLAESFDTWHFASLGAFTAAVKETLPKDAAA